MSDNQTELDEAKLTKSLKDLIAENFIKGNRELPVLGFGYTAVPLSIESISFKGDNELMIILSDGSEYQVTVQKSISGES